MNKENMGLPANFPTKFNIEFPIEKVKLALETEHNTFNDKNIDEKIVAISLKDGENSKSNPDVILMKDMVQLLYDEAVSNNQDTVTVPYEMPSEQDWKEAGFVRDGDFMKYTGGD